MGYRENSDQWVPCGDVLRCIIYDGGPEGEVTIHINNKELSLAEFGRLLTVNADWGMRMRSSRRRSSTGMRRQGAQASAAEGASETVTAAVTVGLPPQSEETTNGRRAATSPDGQARNLRKQRAFERQAAGPNDVKLTILITGGELLEALHRR